MVNKVILQGRFTTDPAVENKGGFDMCEFTVAWSDKFKDRETRCFLRCKSWREQAQFISKYFKKGQEVIIEGRLETEEWEKDGKKQSRTVCNVEKVNFCGPKADFPSNIAKPEAGSEDFMKVDPKQDEELPFS